MNVPKQNLPGTNERGAVLVLVALLSITMLLIAALAIDSNMLWTSDEQAKQYGRLATLSAIDQYFATDCPSAQTAQACSDSRLASALSRTNDLSALNAILSDRGQTPQAGISLSSTAKLEAGTWAAGAFSPLSSGNYSPNAIRLSGNFYPKASTVFAGALLGSSSVPLNMSTTAYYRPRRGVFLLDMSRSWVRETHNEYFDSSNNLIDHYEYAYLYNYYQDFNATVYLTGGYDSNRYYSILWNARPVRPSGILDPLQHWQSDFTYSGWTEFVNGQAYSPSPLADRDYVASSYPHHPDPALQPNYSTNVQTFKMDYWRDSVYRGPEPLTSILTAVNQSIQTFSHRNHSEDRASIIAFDDKLEWPRVLNQTNDWPYLSTYTDFASNGPSQSINQDISGGGQCTPGVPCKYHWMVTDPKLYLLTRYMLFPKYTFTYYSTTGLPPGTFLHQTDGSNIKMALQEALNQLGPNPNPERDFIVLMSDGFSNCSGSGASYLGTAPAPCRNTLAAIRQSWAEIDDFVTNTILPLKIPVHVIHVGDVAGPYTNDLRKPGGNDECYSDEEVRALGKEFEYIDSTKTAKVDPVADWDNWYSGPLPIDHETSRYMYNLALRTRGRYYPIRPNTDLNCPADPAAAKACPVGATYPHPRYSDPLCRSKQQQISDALSEIIGKREYYLVN